MTWMVWLAMGSALAEDADEHEGHRAIGAKLVELLAFEEEEVTTWTGLGFIAERPIGHRGVVEIAVQGLVGRPGFSVPVDLLLKRVWSVQRTTLTAGGGPSLTGLWREGETHIFPGVLGSFGGSVWIGPEESWGILAEVDAGGSFEREGFVPELEFAVGAVWSL